MKDTKDSLTMNLDIRESKKLRTFIQSKSLCLRARKRAQGHWVACQAHAPVLSSSWAASLGLWEEAGGWAGGNPGGFSGLGWAGQLG